MRVDRGRTYVTSELTVDGDLDFLTLWQAKRLALPATGEALRKGNRDIGTAEIATDAGILLTQLEDAVCSETELAAGITTHAGVATAHQDAPGLIATHAGLPNAHHTPPTVRTIAVGNYSGDGNDDRQITVGFKCTLVIVKSHYSSTYTYHLTTRDDRNIQFLDAGVDCSKLDCLLHATDGFVVDNLYANQSGWTYYYWAISE